MLKKLVEWCWGKKVIGIFGEVKVMDDNGEWHVVLAKIDTGAYRTSLDIGLAKKWGLLTEKHVKQVIVSNVHGKEKRQVYKVNLLIEGKKIKSELSVFDRKKMRYAVIIGRLDLDGFLVKTNPTESRKVRFWVDEEAEV